MLADLGATVIKVEAGTGDSMRYVLRNPHTKGDQLGDRLDFCFQLVSSSMDVDV